jgi:hypothetical protein
MLRSRAQSRKNPRWWNRRRDRNANYVVYYNLALHVPKDRSRIRNIFFFRGGSARESTKKMPESENTNYKNQNEILSDYH